MTERQRRTLAGLLSGAGRGGSPTPVAADHQSAGFTGPSRARLDGKAPHVPRAPRQALLTV
jgi:hypothetical protein